MRTMNLGKSLLVVGILLAAALWAFGGGGVVVQARAEESLAATGHPQPVPPRPLVSTSLQHDVSPPLRDLLPLAPAPARALPRRPLPLRAQAAANEPNVSDPVLQTTPGQTAMPAPLLSFEGVNNVDEVLPPDTIGDVGPNHYVQMVNVSFAIWNKQGVKLYGPAAINTLWQGFGGPCQSNNDGDPVVLYDHVADRWLMSQFALPNFPSGPYYQCIAISRTGDPTGAWHRYAFLYHQTKMNDYPKFGVWPDGYYMSANQFTFSPETWAGQGVVVFERDKMLLGQPARMVYFDLFGLDEKLGGMLPSDLDGPTPPPAGAPNYFVEVDDDAQGFPRDQLQIWQFHVDWSRPANSVFTQTTHLPVAAFDGVMCGGDINCIPQPGVNSASYLDPISDRLMYRAVYRNFGAQQTLVLNHTVDINNANRAGVRWYELRHAGSGWQIFQQGTYAPDATHRWMGSLAMDAAGNIALGYSASSASVYPSIRYAGRLAGDPAGTLAQAETTLQAGGGSQTHDAGRWGDYSMMVVDPSDDCTFWYTQEYYATTSPMGWRTRIGAFRFPSCTTGPVGTVQGRVTNAATGNPIAQARVELGAFVTTTDEQGMYRLLHVPVGTYSLSVSAYGYRLVTTPGVVVQADAVTTRDVALTPLPTLLVSGIVRDGGGQNWPLYARIEISDYPLGPVFTNPATGAYSVSLFVGTTYSFTVSAVSDGYQTQTRAFPLSNATRLQNFALPVDVARCVAPGYRAGVFYNENFEANNGGYSEVEIRPSSWEWGTPTSGPGAAHSGTKVWATNLAGDYGNDENGYLVSPPLDLSALRGQSFRVSWWQWLVTEINYDVADVEASKNGGSTWVHIFSSAGGAVDTVWTEHAAELDSSFAVPNFKIAFRLSSDSSITYPGYYVDDIRIWSGCQPLPGGMVVGNVFDANLSTALNGAGVAHASGATTLTFATPADPALADGFYQLFAPTGAAPMTATLGSGYGPAVRQPTVVARDVVRQNFRLPAGRLAAEPTSLAASVEWGASGSATLKLKNRGGWPATFEISARNEGADPLGTARAAAWPEIKRLASSQPWDKAPMGVLAQGARPEAWGAATPIPSGARYRAAGATCDGKSYYVFGGANMDDAVLAESWRYDAQDDAWTRLADMPMALMNMNASCIRDVIYLVGGYDGDAHTNAFQIYDTATNTWQLSTWPHVGTPMSVAWQDAIYTFAGTPDVSSDVWRYDPTSDEWTGPLAPMPAAVVYGSVAAIDDYIFLVGGASNADPSTDVQRYHPATNTWDASGPQLPNGRMSAIVSWYGDRLYVAGGGGVAGDFWLAYDDTWALDPALWPNGDWSDQNEPLASAVVAPAYSCVDDRIYAATGTNGLHGADVNQYLDQGQRCHIAIAPVPWLTMTPISGTIPAQGEQIITLGLDAAQTQIPEPGRYLATLRIDEDTPYQLPAVPVTMTVTAPATYGRLVGVVTGRGYCDAGQQALADAEVTVTASTGVTRTARSNGAGAYSLWLLAAASPYTVTVNHPGYEQVRTSGVSISRQMTTTLDFALRWLQPCSRVTPGSFDITVGQGLSATLPLTLTNTGAGALSFALREKESVNAPNPNPQGGPDEFGYTYRDSRTSGGPRYQWVEIAPPAGGDGSEITKLKGQDDAYFWPLPVPFAFPFYGESHTEVAVATNGVVYFEDKLVSLNNVPIPGPNTYGVHAFLAPFWDDLLIRPGAVYYKAEPGRFIIEYYEVGGYECSQPATWEIILYASGNILFQYRDVVFGCGRDYGAYATIGIQGDDATGLEYSFNTSRLRNGLAICFAYPGEREDCTEYSDVSWLSATPVSGTVASQSSTVVAVTLDASLAVPRSYFANLVVLSNDPLHGRQMLPVRMNVVTYTPLISDIRVTNVRDTAATISWLTDVAADGIVAFGLDPDHVHRTAPDDRGPTARDDTHFVTLSGLLPNTTYSFAVRSGSSQADNEGAFYRFKTGPTLALPPADTVFGRAFTRNGGAPAAGTLIYLALRNSDDLGSPGQSAPLAALTDANGYWSANLGNARTPDLAGSFSYTASGDQLVLEARGAAAGVRCPTPIVIAAARPAPDLILGPAGACPDISQTTLKRGWNFIALPLTPATPLTAASFCAEVNQQGGALAEVDRWQQAGWDGHLCGVPTNAFGLELGSGYFVRNNATSVWNLKGAAVTQPVSLALHSGWNAISIPHTGAYTAASLCNEIISQGALAIEIDRWQNGGWSGHLCGLPFDDFPIERQRGYFLFVNSTGVVTPRAPAAADALLAAPAPASPPASIPAEPIAAANVQIGNLRDTSVTIAWLTDVLATGFVVYGETEALDSYAFDVRGFHTASRTHYVVLDDLKPDTTYFYRIVSGGDVSAASAPASFRTRASLAAPPSSDTIYGQVFKADGVTPAAGAILYLTLQDADGQGTAGQSLPMAALVDANGYWHANLGNARQGTTDGQPFAYSQDGDRLAVEAQSEDGLAWESFETGALRPAAPVVFGQSIHFYLPLLGREINATVE